mmetsp:Transcript_8308/g.9433  ORF Transcript_8308/g.9433 Transcript_8308/m.9433 type:complete len:234 (+) Transcript_8308:2336-3037(+)
MASGASWFATPTTFSSATSCSMRSLTLPIRVSPALGCALATSISFAFWHTSRASGSDTTLWAFSMRGRILGRKFSARERRSSTNLTMFSTIRAEARLVTPFVRTAKPPTRIGDMMARVGPSTVCTKVVDARVWTHSGISFGRSRAEIRVGTNGTTSSLTHRAHSSDRASPAAFFTCFLRSCRVFATAGMASLRQLAVASGADLHRDATNFMRASFACQLLEGLRSSGMIMYGA